MRLFWLAFVPLFVAVDPIGIVPLFIGLCGDMEPAQRRRVVLQSMVTALIVAVGFIFVGKLLLKMLGVTTSDFLVAGGALLFVIALLDLAAATTHRPRLPPDATVGAVPVGVPLIVGPAVLTTLLLLHDQVGPLMTALAVVTNVLLAGVVLYWSQELLGWLGAAGTRVLSKLASLILAALAVRFIRHGVEGIIALAHTTGGQ